MTVFLFLCFWCIASVWNAWLIMKTMEFLIEVSKRRTLRLLMLAACFALAKTVIFVGDPVNIVCATSFFLFAVKVSCGGGLWKKAAIGLMYTSVFFAFNAIRDNYIIYDIRLLDRQPMLCLTLTAAISLLFAVFLYVCIRKYAPDEDYELSDSMWKLLILLEATPFSIVFSIVILFHRYEMENNWITTTYEYAVILIFAFLSFISLFWCVLVLAKQQKLEHQSMLAEINGKYYESLEQQHFEMRRFRHDFANHIQVLSVLLPEQRDEYIRNLAKNIAVAQPLPYCKDTTVNAVLSVKKNMMEYHGIHMEAAVDIQEELPFDKTDICALYANALDNAMEACMKLEEECTVMLISKARKGLFCLEVCNPAAGEDPEALFSLSGKRKSGHMPPTSKMDKGNHGLGLKSIKEIVERYGGGMELKTEGGIFNLFLYLPLSGQSRENPV